MYDFSKHIFNFQEKHIFPSLVSHPYSYWSLFHDIDTISLHLSIFCQIWLIIGLLITFELIRDTSVYVF